MELLALSDIHGKINKVKEVFSEEKDFDLVVLIGDITDFGPRKRAEDILDLINDYSDYILGIPGNCDPKGIEKVIDEKAVLIDEKIANFGGIEFAGLGGSNPTPFDTPRERSEEEIYDILSNLLGDIGEESVLVSHAPAKGYLDLASGEHAGSESVLKSVKENKPKLVLSGHIHEAKGQNNIGKTVLVNPGAVRDGDYAMITYDEEIDINFY